MRTSTVQQSLRGTAWQANLVGALVTHTYFRFVDGAPPCSRCPPCG
jgi:hypothetical protein